MLLAEYLRKTGRSQQKLADELGVSQGLISQYLKGRTAMSAERAMEIEALTQGLIRARELRPDLPWPTVQSS